tara:strand:- start:1174 stop:1764 length:591 start_codon:yes stop_codon:yes gene_type:complete
MTHQFKRGDIVVFNNMHVSSNMQKELASYYNKYNINVGDKGKISRRNINGWIRVKFNDIIVSMRKHDLIKYQDDSESVIYDDDDDDEAIIQSNDDDEVIIESNDEWTTPDSTTPVNGINTEELFSQITVLTEKLNYLSNISEARQVINLARIKEVEENNRVIMVRLAKFESELSFVQITKETTIEKDSEWLLPEVD